jgi:hypothetical protein
MKKGALGLAAGILLYLAIGTSPAGADTLSGTFSTINNFSKNHVVVFVLNQAGGFVRTLRLWGKPTSGYLNQFKVWDSFGKNVVDAVTSATASGSITDGPFSWNGKDVTRASVPHGKYQLVFEVVEWNNKWKILYVPFEFDGTSKTVPRSDTNNFKNVKINIVGIPVSVNQTPAASNKIAAAITIGSNRYEMPLWSKGPISIDLFTLNGSRVLHQNLPAFAGGPYRITEPVNPGAYLMTASTKQESVQTKVLISR